MSVEAAKVVDETKPAETAAAAAAAVESSTTAAAAETPAATEAAAAAPTDAAKSSETAPPAEPAAESAAAAAAKEATPATEGILGFKSPGFLKQLYYSKHFFWFSDEPVASESLNTFVRSEKADSPAHQHAAWARETGKGVLFHSKRAEDKSHPTGVILLHDVANIAKEGLEALSFKLGNHTYKLEAPSSAERDSWLAAIEKKVEEARGLKDDILNRDSYKKNLEHYAKAGSTTNGVVAAGRFKSKSKEPKELKEAASKDVKETAAATPAAAAAAAAPAADAEAKAEEPVAAAAAAAAATPAVEDKKARKDRSQSRKRSSIFGSILPKKEEKEAAAAAADTADVKKEAATVEETPAAKKEESNKAVEVAEGAAAAVGVVGAAAVAAVAVDHAASSDDKKEDKEEEDKATTPTDKKSKRASVFGTLFKKPATAATNGDKADKEAAPATPAKDNVVSETAPKLEEPIENKAIDTAAVTAPADAAAATDAAAAAAAAPETATAAATASSPTAEEPKTEKKGGFFAGLIKKADAKKDEAKEVKDDKAAETTAAAAAGVAATATAAAAAVTTTASTTDSAAPATATATAAETTDGAAETAAVKDERQVNEKRRTSLFAGLGTIKRKTKDDKDAAADASEESPVSEVKREKSPLARQIGGLLRRPSKAVKSGETKETSAVAAAVTDSTAPVAEEEATTAATPAAAKETVTDSAEAATKETAAEATGESQTVVEKVQDAVASVTATTVPEVKASA